MQLCSMFQSLNLLFSHAHIVAEIQPRTQEWSVMNHFAQSKLTQRHLHSIVPSALSQKLEELPYLRKLAQFTTCMREWCQTQKQGTNSLGPF